MLCRGDFGNLSTKDLEERTDQELRSLARFPKGLYQIIILGSNHKIRILDLLRHEDNFDLTSWDSQTCRELCARIEIYVYGCVFWYTSIKVQPNNACFEVLAFHTRTI